MPKSTQQSDNQPWSDCPTGEVSGLVGRLQRRHRSEQRRQLAAGVACLAIVLVAGFYAIPRLGLNDANHAGIVCADVHRLADDYVASHFDGDMNARIEAHLQRCPPCRELVEELRSSQQAAVDDIRTDLVAMSLGSL